MLSSPECATKITSASGQALTAATERPGRGDSRFPSVRVAAAAAGAGLDGPGRELDPRGEADGVREPA